MISSSDIKFSKPIFDDSELILFDRTQYIKEYLSFVMKDLREQEGISQAELAERLDVKQPAVAKLEKADRHHDIENVMRYLHAVGAELSVGIKYKDQFYQVSEPTRTIIVDVPDNICVEAHDCQIDVRTYVHEALGHYYIQGQDFAEQMLAPTLFTEEELAEVV